jgi:hypothetical protein
MVTHFVTSWSKTSKLNYSHLMELIREVLSSVALTGAAVVFAKAFTPATQNQNSKTQSLMPAGVLPASKAKLSSSYILQLRELQQLRELGWEY